MSNVTIPSALVNAIELALKNPGKQYRINPPKPGKLTGFTGEKKVRNGMSPDPIYRRVPTKTKGTTYKQTIHLYQLRNGEWYLFNPVWRFSSTPKMTVEAPGQALIIADNLTQLIEFRMEYKDDHKNFYNDLLEMNMVIGL